MINLYDLAIELLKERGIWEQLLQAENTISKDELRSSYKVCLILKNI